MNIELMDKEGSQIQATFFNDAADKFDKIIQENRVYLFSGGSIKIANKKFTSIKNDYCLNFDNNTEVVEVKDDPTIKKQGFSFSHCSDIKDFPNQK